MSTNDPMITTEEIARRLRLAPGTVRAWTRTGKIPSIRLGHRTVRYDWEKVLAALNGTDQGK